MRYSFKNDYGEGGHPSILHALTNTNLTQQEGYGEDEYCKKAVELLKKKLKSSSDIHFVSGGTQANLIVIAALLKPFESVISATTAHINIHEAGAIEAGGHKINVVESEDGKLTPNQIKSVLAQHTDEHMVKPRLVFISNSTELGTIYKKRELELLHSFCKSHDLLLYMDGARLGFALSSEENDVKLSDLAKLVDIFYIGGTKNGALIGEAIVINTDCLKQNFRFHLKQKGALLAKGRLFGVQFIELFRDYLFFDLAKHANLMALKIAETMHSQGYSFLVKTTSNQIFPILPNKVITRLQKKYDFYVWRVIDTKTSAIRIVTSWATKEAVVEEFIEDIVLAKF